MMMHVVADQKYNQKNNDFSYFQWKPLWAPAIQYDAKGQQNSDGSKYLWFGVMGKDT